MSTIKEQREDDHYWRLGLFYANRKDKAFLVPKRIGIGWTVNFASPITWE